MTARPQGFSNRGYNSLLLDADPVLTTDQTENNGGTLMDIGSIFATRDSAVPARGSQDGHIPVAVLAIVALSYLVVTRRLGMHGLHLTLPNV